MKSRLMAALAAFVAALAMILAFTGPATADPSGPTGLPPGSPSLTSCSTLEQGSQGECVLAVQHGFNILRFNIAADGKYGPQTMMAVRVLQTERHLPVTSIADAATLKALDTVLRDNSELPVPSPSGTVLSNGVFKEHSMTSTSFYLSRSATAALNDALNNPDNQLAVNAGSAVICTAAGKGGAALGIVCEVISIITQFEASNAADNAVDQGGCFEIHRINYHGAVTTEMKSNNGHNCIP